MPETKIGICSLCGGDVVAYEGAWYGVQPPPPPKCTGCGAKKAENVIKMVKP